MPATQRLVDECGDIEFKDLEVAYVKLSLDPARLNAMPPGGQAPYDVDVRNCYWRDGDECNGGVPFTDTVLHPNNHAMLSCPFPQQPTTDQHFRPEQFRAYRKLGRDIVLNYCRTGTGAQGASGTKAEGADNEWRPYLCRGARTMGS